MYVSCIQYVFMSYVFCRGFNFIYLSFISENLYAIPVIPN